MAKNAIQRILLKVTALLPTPAKMMIYFTLIFSIFLSLSSAEECKSELKRMAYYVKKAENEQGYFPVQKINASLITHLICISDQEKINDPLEFQNLKVDEWMKDIRALKINSPSLKIIFSVNVRKLNPQMIKNKEQIKAFARVLVQFLIKNNLDGVEIDWQFPISFEKLNFVNLLKEIREEINSHTRSLLLSIVVPPCQSFADYYLDLENINKYFDIVNLIGYFLDFQQFAGSLVYHNSPLFQKKKSYDSFYSTLSIKWQAESFVAKGMDKSKIVISLPAFGRGWILEDKNDQLLGVHMEDLDPFQVQSQSQMCSLLREGYTSAYAEEVQCPYAYKGNTWVSYDDERSIAFKTKWAEENGYGGVSIFNINSDDNKIQCRGTRFPLLTAAYNAVCK